MMLVIAHNLTSMILFNQTTGGSIAALGSMINSTAFWSISGAIIGAVVATAGSQVLATYRNDLQKARKFDAIIEHMKLATDEELDPNKKAAMLKEIEKELRQFYIEEQWLISEDGRQVAREVIRDISNHVNPPSSERYPKNLKELTDSIHNKANTLKDERHHVHLRHSWKRYLGKRDAYSDE